MGDESADEGGDVEVGDDGHEVLEEPERGFLRVEKGRVIDRVYEGYGLVRAGWINVLEAGGREIGKRR